MNDFYNKFKPKELDDVKVLYLHAHGPGLLHTKTPVRTLEDLKGMKIRATGTTAKIVTALGATPVAMPMSDSYDAISRGVAQGIVCPVESLQGWKLGEVIKYTTQDFGAAYSVTFFVVMNKAQVGTPCPRTCRRRSSRSTRSGSTRRARPGTRWTRPGAAFAAGLGDTVIPLSAEENARWAKAVRAALRRVREGEDRERAARGRGPRGCARDLKELQP